MIEGGLAIGGVGIEQSTFTAASHSHAYRGGEALTERSGGHLNALGVTVLRVSRREGTPGAQRSDVLQLQAVACEIQLVVKSERGVTDRQHETVTTNPVGVSRVMAHNLLEKGIGQG